MPAKISRLFSAFAHVLLLMAVAALPSFSSAAEAPTQIIAARAASATVGVYSEKDGDRFYGTGVIIDPQGHILTSTTVVPDEAGRIEVYFADHTSAPARIVQISHEVEIALLRLEGRENLPFLPLARELPAIGSPAYTLGNAGNMIKLGDGASFSAGVVSGIYEVQSADSQSGYHGLVIETSATVSHGQDGGPLLDQTGRVTGIITRSYCLARWQGAAVPLKNILAYMPLLLTGQQQISHDPLLPEGEGASPFVQSAQKIADALVGLEVKRLYSPERIARRDWVEYRKSIPDWESLPEDRRRLLTADFFAADSLLAANQMLRRPADNVTGLLISPAGYILTSAFNVQSGDMVYIAKGTEKPLLPEYDGDMSRLYGLKSSEYRRVSNRVLSMHAVLPDGRTVPAEIVGFNIPLEIALLKVSVDYELPFFDIAKAQATARPGLAVGLLGVAPGRHRFTINTGIISATGRNNGRFHQFDALLNYGNSGGPLIDAAGNFLGLAGSPLSPAPVMGKILPFTTPVNDPGGRAISDFPNTPNSGIGMAASAGQIMQVLPQMMQGAAVERGSGIYLGFSPSAESAFSRRVVVGRVTDNSPAQRAGLQTGDEVLTVDGVALRSWKELRDYLGEKRPGDTVLLEVFRSLGKPYLFMNNRKFEDAQELLDFIGESPDGLEVSGKVYRPGVRQQIYLTLGKE